MKSTKLIVIKINITYKYILMWYNQPRFLCRYLKNVVFAITFLFEIKRIESNEWW